jgi:predicted TIM-barrel fold metal-dependent hydrolase
VPLDLAPLIAPWTELVLDQIPGLEVFDAHTHLGRNDPDGMKQTPEELIVGLREAHARGAFVFPMHEPEGYPSANDMVLAAAAESGGLLVPFCRVNPRTDGVREAKRSLDAGARGIKLHPRAEQFALDHPAVRELVALADERALPVLIHAGRGIPALGLHAVELAGEFPNAQLILAHAAICDLSWIWRVAADHPNLFFDTAWWMPADMLTLFSLVPPGQILFASDSPYGRTGQSVAVQFRLALQAGLTADQIRSIGSEQSVRIAAGECPEPAGPPVGEREQAPHLLLDRVAEVLLMTVMTTMRGPPEAAVEGLALARLACDVPDEIDDAPTFAAIRSLMDVFDELTEEDPTDRRRLGPLIMAATVARTPDVPVPTPDFAPRSVEARST